MRQAGEPGAHSDHLTEVRAVQGDTDVLIGGYQEPIGQSPYWERYMASFTTPNLGYVPPVASNPWLTAPSAYSLPFVPQAPAGNQVLYQHYAPQAVSGQQANTAPAAPAASATPAAPNPAVAPKPEPATVTVKGGDNLSKIAAANGTSWKAIYELNKDVIGGNPNLIRPGQVLKMP